MKSQKILVCLIILIICCLGNQLAYAVTLKVDKVFAAPGKSVDVPIRLSGQNAVRPVSAIQFTFTYSAQLLTITSKPTNGPLLEGVTVITNPQSFPSNSGKLIFIAFTTAGSGFYKAGEDLLVSIPFEVKAGISEQEIPLNLQSVVATDKDSAEIPVTPTDGAINIDATAPTTTPILSGTIGDNGWYKSNVTVNLPATDNLSGVKETKYKIGSGNWQTYPPEFTLSTEGTTTIYYYSVDNVDNTESEKSTEIKIDKTPPTTTPTLSGTSGENDWYISNVEIILSAVDNVSKVEKIEYKVNAGSWQPYPNKPIIISTEGTTTVYYRAIDKAGNQESDKSISLNIDKTKPTGTVSINGGADCTTTREVTLDLSASDSTSGVSKMRLKNEAGNWSGWENYNTTKDWTLTSGDGTKTVSVQYKDTAGLISNAASDSIVLDTTAPTIASKSPEGDNIPVETSIQVEFSEAMNQSATEGAFSIQITEGFSTQQPAGTKSWNGNTLIFAPDSDLAYCAIYTVTISNSAKDLCGNPLTAVSWSFTTLGAWGDVAPKPGTGGLPQGNDKVDVGDTLRVARISVGNITTPTKMDDILGDVAPSPGQQNEPYNGNFGDGNLDMADALRIARYAAELIDDQDFPEKRASPQALNVQEIYPKLIVENATAHPNETVNVNIRLTEQNPNRPIAAIQFTLSYDEELLSIAESPIKGPIFTEKATVVTNPQKFPSDSGNLIFGTFTLAQNGFFQANEDLLISIPFSVAENISVQEIPLTLTIETATDMDSNKLIVNPQNGKITLKYYGDVSGDQKVTVRDASFALQHVVGGIKLSLDEQDAADVTGDGNVTALDIALILQYSAGLITKFPREQPSLAPARNLGIQEETINTHQLPPSIENSNINE